MRRETQNVLLLLLGLSVAVMVVKGAYLHYVKPSLLPWLVISAIMLTGLAIVSIVRDVRSGGAEHHDGHSHSTTMVWLLLVPVVVTAFVVPPPIEANGATPTVAAAQPTRRDFAPLPPERAPVVSVPEVMMRAATDSAGTLDGRLITIIGFTMKGSGGPDLARVVIICCAADAQLARIHIEGPAAAAVAAYPLDTWLRVEGQVVPGSSTAATSFVPTMAIATVTKIDRPANTYSY